MVDHLFLLHEFLPIEEHSFNWVNCLFLAHELQKLSLYCVNV